MNSPSRADAAILALVAAALLAAAAAPASSPAAAPETRLVAALVGATPLEDDLRHLCDRIGGRATGGAGCERSIDWFLERFKAAGVDHAWTESFAVPSRWDEGDATTARLTAPEEARLSIAAMPYCADTPPGGLEAPVVSVREGTAEDFAAAGERARGAWLLLDSRVIATFEDLFGDYLRMPEIMRRAGEAGAAGILVVGGRDHGMLYRHIVSFGEPARLPMAVVARQDGLRLARLASAVGAKPVRVRVDLDVRPGPRFTSRNVIAEIRGRESPDEVVLAGAHLDSWDLGTGALDNGANCVMLLDIARQVAALGARPRRSVRFALFTGEEQGVFGSLGYARTHRAELDRHALAAIFDIGTGRITGFSLGGRADLEAPVKRALRPVASLKADRHTTDAFVGTDNFDFLLEGVPNVVAHQAESNYMEHYHAESDTFERTDVREMRTNATIVASLLWGIADAPERAPRQTRAEIEALLQKTGLAGQMKTFGLWEAWEKKERGRPE